jgi:hypothetical protein
MLFAAVMLPGPENENSTSAEVKKTWLYTSTLLTSSWRSDYLVKQLPLWSSGQSSWLQIRRSGFDSRHYQKKKVVGLERGPLSLVNTTEELLDRKVVPPV